jgi:hypothetical protein
VPVLAVAQARHEPGEPEIQRDRGSRAFGADWYVVNAAGSEIDND